MARNWDPIAAEFHRDNPHVFERLRDMALQLKAAGKTKYAINGLYHVLRWQDDLETTDEASGFLLNDAYLPFYARELMRTVPELKGFFNLRKRRWA